MPGARNVRPVLIRFWYGDYREKCEAFEVLHAFPYTADLIDTPQREQYHGALCEGQLKVTSFLK
jgi:hypothetical protein